MSGSTVCRFYLKGCCQYGSKCRFLHSKNNGRYNQHDDDGGGYQPRNRRNASQEYYDDYSYDNRRYNDNHSQYERNHYSKQDYDNTSYYNHRGQNHRDNYNNYHAKNNNYQSEEEYYDGKSQNHRDNYNNYHAKNNKYQSEEEYYDGKSQNHRDNYNNYHAKNNNYQSEEEYYDGKSQNYRDNYRKESANGSHYNRRNKNDNMYGEYKEKKNYENSNSNRYNGSEDRIINKNTYEQNNANPRETLLKKYENEIKIYRRHVNEYINSNVWPLSCFYPIGYKFPIQAIGCLNFMDASFEEIRCDLYALKKICADPVPVHSQSFHNVLIEARKKKEDVLEFGPNVQDDLLATFKKCEQSRDDPNFQNNLETTNQHSFWNMSIKRLNQDQMNSFSFSMGNVQPKNEKNPSKNEPPLKIFMQTEVYGKGENDMYAQKDFTDFIPLMPPPKHYCL